MSCAVAPDCSGFPLHCPLAAPDSDVAGIGVVWGFGLTSFVTVALSAPIALLSLVDFLVGRSPQLRWLAKRIRFETPEQHEGWVDNLVHIIMGLSDQQLVTGLAILVVGFSKHCSMASRHFWVVFDLAWFSSVTHLASLPVLNYYLHSYPRWRDFRVVLMLSNFGFLIAAAILTFGNYGPASHDCPIQCAFDHFRTSDFPISKIHVTQMVFVTFGFIWALAHLYAPEEIWRIRHKMIVDRGFATDMSDLRLYVEKSRNRLSRISSHHEAKDILNDAMHFRHVRFGYFTFISKFHRKHEDSKAYLIFRWVLLMLFAPPSAIVWANLVSMWCMGAVRLVQDREWSLPDENEWGFGQVLPLLLLVLPFFTITEVAQEYVLKQKVEAVSVDKVTTTACDAGPDSKHDATLTITCVPGDATTHVELANVPADHVKPAKLAHPRTEPNRPEVKFDSSSDLPKRSLTSPTAFSPGKQATAESPSLISPTSPFSPMDVPPTTRSGYNFLPGEEWDIEGTAASTTAKPLGDHDHPS